MSWGFEPIFFPFIKLFLPQQSKIENDPVICDREHEILKKLGESSRAKTF